MLCSGAFCVVLQSLEAMLQNSGLHKAAAILLGICSIPIWGQTSQTQTPSSQGGYVFHANSREVLTDVTVTDNDGNTVHGLSRSAFHIFDDNRPEQLESFAEHAGSPAAAATSSAAPSNVFSNDYLLHPPPSINVILLDTTTIDVIDQMFLNQELTKFVKALPANKPLAIYERAADGTILLQSFTSDHNLLLTAIRRAIPRLRQQGSQYANDFDTLQQIGVFLDQIPGRKNVLWFTGGSNAFLRTDPTDLLSNQSLAGVSGEFLREVYDELETERIALYPIDARGLIVDDLPGKPEQGTLSRIGQQQMLMTDMAEATGGQVSYNDNGMAQIASHVLDTDTDFYTLTYRPNDLKADNKWHKVKIAVDGPYYVSYRRGYFDDGTGTPTPPRKTRTVLRAHGETVQGPDRHAEPIIFEARVQPSIATQSAGSQAGGTSHAPKRNELAYAVQYSVPADALTQETVNGKIQINFGAAILAFNHFGRATGHVVQKLTFTLNAEKLKANPEAKIGFDQQINLPKGEDYLYIALWDMTNGRLGTLQIPLEVEKNR